MVNKEFIKNVETACESALTAHGFKRLRRGCVVWEISDDFLGWIGLNQGNHGELLRINPFVGVHAIEMMKLCASLENEKYVKGQFATYAIHLGELIPDEPCFEFRVGEPLESEADRLAGCIWRVGLNYMQSIATYETILPLLKERMPMLGGYPQRYLSTLHFLGEHQLARKLTSDTLGRRGDMAQYWNEHFITFGENYLNMLKNI